MANNYCQSSSEIMIPRDKLKQARAIEARIAGELESDPDEGYVGYNATFFHDDQPLVQLWIREDESINPDHVERLVKALVEELDLPGIHVVSWAYTCNKPRIDEFGGGAFAVQKGRKTVWVDAASEARRQMEVFNKPKLKRKP